MVCWILSYFGLPLEDDLLIKPCLGVRSADLSFNAVCWHFSVSSLRLWSNASLAAEKKGNPQISLHSRDWPILCFGRAWGSLFLAMYTTKPHGLANLVPRWHVKLLFWLHPKRTQQHILTEFNESKVNRFLGCEKNHTSEMKLTILNAIFCDSVKFKYISQKFKRNWATGTITKRNWVLWPWPVSSIFQPGWTWPAWCDRIVVLNKQG